MGSGTDVPTDEGTSINQAMENSSQTLRGSQQKGQTQQHPSAHRQDRSEPRQSTVPSNAADQEAADEYHSWHNIMKATEELGHALSELVGRPSRGNAENGLNEEDKAGREQLSKDESGSRAKSLGR